MSIKRFMWVRGPSSRCLHVKFGNTSEGLTKCGIFAAKGWWIIGTASAKASRKCKRCSA